MSTPFKYQICQQQPEFVRVTMSGIAGVEQIECVYQEVFDLSSSHQVHKVLVDAKSVKLSYPLTEFLPLMNRLSSLLKDHKIARVCHKDEFRQGLIEAAGTKSQLALRNFQQECDALDWLLA